jgi:hypothetical protein
MITISITKLLLLFLLTASIPSIILTISLISTKNKMYWQGRADGWKACEEIIKRRALKSGYNIVSIEKLME